MRFCPLSMARQEDVTLDVLQELNEIPNIQLFDELNYIVNNSKYNNYRTDAAYAFMLIYAHGLRGESIDYKKAYFWCNKIVESDRNESSNMLNCNRFIESK